MTGLRAQNKADRSLRILQTAARLFRERGYDAVHIDAIAAEAGLSAGTVYNYFTTKGDVLLAIVTMEVEEVLTQGEAVLSHPGPTFEAALGALIGGYYDHSLHYLSKEMWRAAMAQNIASPDSAFARHYTALDARLTGQVCALLQRLQARGDLRAGLDAENLGGMIFNDINQLFMDFVRDDALPVAQLQDRLAARLAMLAPLVRA